MTRDMTASSSSQATLTARGATDPHNAPARATPASCAVPPPAAANHTLLDHSLAHLDWRYCTEFDLDIHFAACNLPRPATQHLTDAERASLWNRTQYQCKAATRQR